MVRGQKQKGDPQVASSKGKGGVAQATHGVLSRARQTAAVHPLKPRTGEKARQAAQTAANGCRIRAVDRLGSKWPSFRYRCKMAFSLIAWRTSL